MSANTAPGAIELAPEVEQHELVRPDRAMRARPSADSAGCRRSRPPTRSGSESLTSPSSRNQPAISCWMSYSVVGTPSRDAAARSPRTRDPSRGTASRTPARCVCDRRRVPDGGEALHQIARRDDLDARLRARARSCRHRRARRRESRSSANTPSRRAACRRAARAGPLSSCSRPA